MVGTILAVLWLILKIILWILLALIGIVFLLILMVLFVPIRYKVEGSKYATIEGKGKVTYLLRLIRASFHYTPEGYGYKVKVLFFTLLSEDVALGKSKVEEPIVEEEVEAQEPTVTTMEATTPNTEVSTSTTVHEGEQKIEPQASTSEEKDTIKPKPKEKTPKKPKEKKKKVKKKKPKKETSKVEKEGESTKEQVLRFYGFLREEENIGVLRFIIRKLLKAIGSILPKKFRGNVHFGLDDPAMTAYILGGASIFYPKYKDSLTLTPDFEETVIEGDLDIRGYILPCIFVWALIRIYLDGRVRRLIKEVRKKT